VCALIKKENKIFLIYKDIQTGAVAKSYMMNGFLIYEEMRKYLVISHTIYDCTTAPFEFLIYDKNLIFFFVSVARLCVAKHNRNYFLHRERQRPMRCLSSQQVTKLIALVQSWGTVSIQKYSAHSKV
jgi:hypothetical protein